MFDYSVGQQVVCVDDDWVDLTPGARTPVLGGIYTISYILPLSPIETERDLSFRLAEIYSINSWYHWHFRPVKKTDISEFLKLSNPTPTKKKKKRVLEDA